MESKHSGISNASNFFVKLILVVSSSRSSCIVFYSFVLSIEFDHLAK